MLKCIQLSRLKSTTCCMTKGGRAQANAARKIVGWPALKNWTLKRTLVEVLMGEGLPNSPPKTRRRVFLTMNGVRTNRMHPLQDVSTDDSLRGVGVQERDATESCGSGGLTINGGFGGKQSVVEPIRASDEARAVLGKRGRVREARTAQGATVSTSGLWSALARQKKR